MGRFASADTIVLSGNGGYSPLMVDYHELSLIEKLNYENRELFENTYSELQKVPKLSQAFDRYSYSLNNPISYIDPDGHNPLVAFLVAVSPIGWVTIGFATTAAVVYYVAGGPQNVTNGLYQVGLAASDGLSAFDKKAGGAGQAAQHLAMLLGSSSVAGFAPHPGKPDPEGRDRKDNVEGLRNQLREMKRNMRSGDTIQDYLQRRGWSETQVQDFMSATRGYLEDVLETDVEYYGVSPKLAEEIINLATALGIL